MSRHHIRLMHQGQPVLVVAGYDLPLHELFLQVFLRQGAGSAGEDDILYDSLHEPALDWRLIGTLTDKLVTLGIAVPESLIEAVHLDQCLNAGNRVVRHHADRPPEVLMAG